MAKALDHSEGQDRSRRAAAADNAHHSTRLEGGRIGDYAQALQDCWVEGLITDEQQIAMLKKHHSVG